MAVIKASTRKKVLFSAHVRRENKHKSEIGRLRPGGRKFCATRCKKCWKSRISASSCLKTPLFVAQLCVFVRHVDRLGKFRVSWRWNRGCFSSLWRLCAGKRAHFLQCAHRGDSSRRRGRAFAPPTWVCGRKRRRSERKPAVTRGRYKYFIPGETGSQINSTRGHINDGVVKNFDSPKGDC